VVARNVTTENHFDNYLSDIPVLSFGKKLKYVVLGVEEKFECDGAVMVLQNRFIIVSNCFLMPKSNQKIIVNSWMSDVMQETSKKSGHDLQIRKMIHKISVLHKVVEVSSGFNYS